MSPDTVLTLCQESKIAYGMLPLGVTPLDDGQSKPRGFALRTSAGGILAFAGSESILDWLTDLQCVQKSYDGGFIHSGFLKEFEKVWGQILVAFKGVAQGYPIMVTGHSMGAALSFEAARQLVKVYGASIAHVPFAPPRIYCPKLAADFDALVPNSVRIQHHNDLVCRVPKINYKHAGKLIRIGDDGKEIRFSGIRGTIERWFEVAWADLKGSAETDHLMNNYLSCVLKWHDLKVANNGGVS